jgi:hypothetical protein
LVFRLVRTAISLTALVALLWVAFAVELGDKTFAEHIDSISETPEAQQMIQDTRSTINPALVEARDRVLGEYVEAPTWIAEQPGVGPEGPGAAGSSVDLSKHTASPASPALERPASQASGPEPRLPGQRKPGSEPALPGRR